MVQWSHCTVVVSTPEYEGDVKNTATIMVSTREHHDVESNAQ